MAAERLPELRAVHSQATLEPAIAPPASRAARAWTRDEAIVELLRGRVAIVGPTTAEALAATMGIETADADAALLALESEGVVLRGTFTPRGLKGSTIEWCDRRLLARIHRYTLNRLRAEIEPVSPADFMRFLFAWQHVAPSSRLTGIDGLRAVLESLDGFELAADAWERAVLPDRVRRLSTIHARHALPHRRCRLGAAVLLVPGYDAAGRRDADRAVPARARGGVADTARAGDGRLGPFGSGDGGCRGPALQMTPERQRARLVFDALRARGASFIAELIASCGLDEAAVRSALADLVAAGLVASDGFGGLRTILRASGGRAASHASRSSVTGRWSLLHPIAGAASRAGC